MHLFMAERCDKKPVASPTSSTLNDCMGGLQSQWNSINRLYCCTWDRVRTCVEFVEAFTNERWDNRVLHRWHQTKAKSRETTKTECCNNNQEPWLANPKGPQPGNSWNLRSTMIQRKEGKGGYIYFTFVNLRSGKNLVIILLLKKCFSLVASN